MKTFKHLLCASTAALFLATTAQAQTAGHAQHQDHHADSPVSVQSAWARATVAQQRATGMFMQIKAKQDMKLVSASSDIAAHTEIHEMVKDGDVMKMREVKNVALPAGQAVEFKPGGLHVMFLDLKQQVKAGDVIPVTLTFEDAQGKQETTRVDVTARPLNASGAPAQGASHGHH